MPSALRRAVGIGLVAARGRGRRFRIRGVGRGRSWSWWSTTAAPAARCTSRLALGQRRVAGVDRPRDLERLAGHVRDHDPLVVGHATVAGPDPAVRGARRLQQLVLDPDLLAPFGRGGRRRRRGRGRRSVVGVGGRRSVVGATVVGATVVGRRLGRRRRHDRRGGRDAARWSPAAACVVVGGSVVGRVVVVGGSVVVLSIGGCVGTATLLLSESSSREGEEQRSGRWPTARCTAPATTRAAVTRPGTAARAARVGWIESDAFAASTKATIVPTIGRTMLTIAHTSAATANGSVRGASPQPPDPAPPAPVGSGSGPTGTAPVSSGSHSPRPARSIDIGAHYRRTGRDRCLPRAGAEPRRGRSIAPMTAVLPVTGDADADALLVTDPFALLVGMLLDQQVPDGVGVPGPLVAARAPRPARRPRHRRHARRRPRGRVPRQARAAPLPGLDGQAHPRARHAGRRRLRRRRGRASGRRPRSAEELLRAPARPPRLRRREGEDLPRHPRASGSRSRPQGWEASRSPFSDDEPRSVADIDSPEALQRVRAFKQAKKAEKKAKAD